MKQVAIIFSIFLLIAPFSFAQAECEDEAQIVIKRYLEKRGMDMSEIGAIEVKVKSLTPGSYWQRYEVTAILVTRDGRVRLGFIMASPFICEDLSIESVR